MRHCVCACHQLQAQAEDVVQRGTIGLEMVDLMTVVAARPSSHRGPRIQAYSSKPRGVVAAGHLRLVSWV